MNIIHSTKILSVIVVTMMAISVFVTCPVMAKEPGVVNGVVIDDIQSTDELVGSIIPQVTEIGKIVLSVDGLGVFPEKSGNIQVEKPAGATVRGAYLAAADVWGNNGGPLPDGAIQINGNNVTWDLHDPNNANSAWSDVTAIIRPIVDAAPAGILNLTINETIELDGSILAVIFDDPGQTTDNTIILLFGSQDIAGDTFAIGLAEPINTSDPNLILDMSLGISFGAQGCASGQYSQVDVNGIRMTTSAGGEDDGVCSNGALLTVGGLNDSNANPIDPNATDNGDPRQDDELYNLIPFVSDGDTSINVYTQNPSNDDNMFFASLFLASTTAVVGEGILLTPVSASNPIGSQHIVNATVQDDLGNPIVDRDVNFEIISGPHAGLTNTDTTDANGLATFNYTGTSTGTDIIEATMVNSQGDTVASNQVDKEWTSVTTTPRKIKEDAIEKLELAKDCNSRVNREIDIVILLIEKSLEEKLWVDDTHLDPYKGELVFSKEYAAVDRMQRNLLKRSVPNDVKDVFREVIDDLLSADEMLAKKAIEEAKAYEGTSLLVDKEIKLAEKNLEEAYDEMDDPMDKDNAVLRFKRAWEHAIRAIELHDYITNEGIGPDGCYDYDPEDVEAAEPVEPLPELNAVVSLTIGLFGLVGYTGLKKRQN